MVYSPDASSPLERNRRLPATREMTGALGGENLFALWSRARYRTRFEAREFFPTKLAS